MAYSMRDLENFADIAYVGDMWARGPAMAVVVKSGDQPSIGRVRAVFRPEIELSFFYDESMALEDQADVDTLVAYLTKGLWDKLAEDFGTSEAMKDLRYILVRVIAPGLPDPALPKED